MYIISILGHIVNFIIQEAKLVGKPLESIFSFSLCQPIRKRLDAFKQSNPLSKSKSFTQSNDWQVGSLFKSLCYWEIDKSFVILVFLILLTVTVCVTIVCTYFLLNAEDYRWKIKINHIGFTKIFFIFF